MPIDFRYVPVSPEPISGISFIDQTERAINELGANIDASDELAQQAIDTANAANSTANAALQTAQGAEESAAEALAVANQAQTVAGEAVITANNAQAHANDAYDMAAIANSDASQALTIANTAQSTADAAQATATTADQNAATAISVADGAVELASNAMGVFTVTPDVEDANEHYKRAEKIFVTNIEPTTPNLNFPADMTFPAWLEVVINSDKSSVTQTCWDDSLTSKIYTRTANINNSDPDNPVVDWAPWQTVATPNNLKSVETVVDPDGQPPGTYLVFTYDTETGESKSYFSLTGNMPVYTSGNGAVDITSDYRISVKLDPAADNGATISSEGLKTPSLPALFRTQVTSSGAWTAPSTGWYLVEMWGGGGGGGGVTAVAASTITAAGGGGGGGGGYLCNIIRMNAGETQTVQIGAGGTGGDPDIDGGTGGNTSFGGRVAYGGAGGEGGSTSVSTGVSIGLSGGAGGTPGGMSGHSAHSRWMRPGGSGWVTAGLSGGAGGGSAVGRGGRYSYIVSNGVDGEAGQGYAAGGAGGASVSTARGGRGGLGSQGLVIITYLGGS